MKISLVMTIFLLLIVAGFVVQSIVLIFQEFFKDGLHGSDGLHLPSRTDRF